MVLDTDVIVVGAGAAGLAAASVLKRAGLNYITLEASGRIGGRAHTNKSIFGVPCDLGAFWLHYGENHNRFIRYAQRPYIPFDVKEVDSAELIYDLSRRPSDVFLPQPEIDEFGIKYILASHLLNVQATNDKSPYEILKLLPSSTFNNWFGTIGLIIGNWDMGKDWYNFSNKGYQQSPYLTSDYLCKQGFGALLEYAARDVTDNVRLKTKVTEIKYTQNGKIEIQTTKGKLTSRACIVTVSTGVHVKNDLNIIGLPNDFQQACNDVSMGYYNRVVLNYKKDIFGEKTNYTPNSYIYPKVTSANEREPNSFTFVTNIFNTNLIYADVGGSYAEQLENENKIDIITLVNEEIESILGSSVKQEFINAHVTYWGKNPLYRGAFASTKANKSEQRKILLRASLYGSIFFAGEAHHPDYWATVWGAYESGFTAAVDLIKKKFDVKITNYDMILS